MQKGSSHLGANFPLFVCRFVLLSTRSPTLNFWLTTFALYFHAILRLIAFDLIWAITHSFSSSSNLTRLPSLFWSSLKVGDQGFIFSLIIACFEIEPQWLHDHYPFRSFKDDTYSTIFKIGRSIYQQDPWLFHIRFTIAPFSNKIGQELRLDDNLRLIDNAKLQQLYQSGDHSTHKVGLCEDLLNRLVGFSR